MFFKTAQRIGLLTVLMTSWCSGFAQNKVVVVPLGADEAETVTLYGRAAANSDQALIFEWPGTGVEVRTHDDGEGDSIFEVRIINTNAPGGPSFYLSVAGEGSSSLGPGVSRVSGGLAGTTLLITENNGSLGRMMRLHCFANVIAAGDDGFIQCMGITAGDP